MKVLVINGFGDFKITSPIAKEIYGGFAKGLLTNSLVDVAKQTFISKGYEVFETVVNNQYNIIEEQSKLHDCDIVFLQFPMYWYSIPSKLQEYFENVYEFGEVTNENGEKYGDYGSLKGKKYILSATMAAPSSSFNKGEFLSDFTIDSILAPIILTQKFVGFEVLPTILNTDVFEKDFNSMKENLINTINNNF